MTDRHDPSSVAVAFVRTLRQAGLIVPVDASVRFVEALDVLDPGNPDDVYWAGRATLVRRTEDLGTYDLVFAGYFGGRPVLVDRAAPPQPVTLAVDDPEADVSESDEVAVGGPTLQVRFSRIETLRRADFAELDGDELAEAWSLIDRLRLVGAPRPSRRPSPRRAHGGDPISDAPSGTPSAPAASRSGGRTRSPASASDASCCCSTSPGRWRRTHAPCSGSPTPQCRPGVGSRPSPSARASPG